MISEMVELADYNLIERGYILTMILAQEKLYFSKRASKNIEVHKNSQPQPITLNSEQDEAVNAVLQQLQEMLT